MRRLFLYATLQWKRFKITTIARRMVDRQNQDWVSELKEPGAKREAALADLRVLLSRALPHGLSRWLSPSNPEFKELIEDTIQETMMRVLQQLHSFEGKGQFTNWVYKISVRLALNELRKRKWRDVSLDYLTDDDTGLEGQQFQFPSDTPSPEASVQRHEMLQKMQQLINEELTAKQRNVMTAVIIQQVPMEEVARRLGSSRNAVYKMLHDARRKLKSKLETIGLTPAELLSMFDE